MNDINIFLNNKTTNRDSFGLADLSVAIGDLCLTPVRNLFNGNKVVIYEKNEKVQAYHVKEFSNEKFFDRLKRRPLEIIVLVIELVPGVICGSVFKGIGYFSQSIKTQHQIAKLHFIPIDRVIGTKENRLSLKELVVELKKEKKANSLNQPTGNLTIYAQPNTRLKQDPGIVAFDPQKKIILAGAKIIQSSSKKESSLQTKLLQMGWGSPNKTNQLEDNFVQWSVNTVKIALEQLPSRKSFFSNERKKQIYIVN